MSTLLRHVALVSDSSSISASQLAQVAAALQKQATRDLAPIWDVSATVDSFPTLNDVPLDYWPIIVMDDIGMPGAAGVHMDQNGQPYALVTSGTSWPLTASHECIEMLVDPFGKRLVAGDSPKPSQGRVQFLVEACDPSEAAQFGYTVNGVLLSDFYTPHFFDPVVAPGVRYSFTGAIKEPRQVLPGGYLSWQEPVTNHWWQERWFGGNAPTFVDLGVFSASKGSIRSQIDAITSEASAQAMAVTPTVAAAVGLMGRMIDDPRGSRAHRLRSEIAGLLHPAQPQQLLGAAHDAPPPVQTRRKVPRVE